MHKRRLFPRKLAECAAPATQPVLGKTGAMQARLLADWPKIVGEMAAFTEPESLTFPKSGAAEGTLALRVRGAAALEVQHREPVLLESLAVYFGYRAISRLKLIQCASAPEAPKPKARPAISSFPFSDELQDAALRRALQSLGEALQSADA